MTWQGQHERGQQQQAPVGRVVVLRALGLGDLLTAVPALRAVRAAFPAAHVQLAAPAALTPLVRLTDAVDEVVDTPAFVLGPPDPLGPTLVGPDVAVNLHGRGPESHRVLLALAPRRLVAYAHADVPATTGSPTWRADEHEVGRWCRLLEESGIRADPGALELAVPAVAAPVEGAVVVHPGAASGSRRWPPQRWAVVAAALAATGRQVVVTGSAAETTLTSDVATRAGLPPSSVLAGTTSLLELAALVARAEVVLCGDTGLAHLATAYGTRSVVLFGPTPPALWGPPADRPQHRALWAGTAGNPHADTPDPGLLAVTVEDVLAVAHAVLAAQPTVRRRFGPGSALPAACR